MKNFGLKTLLLLVLGSWPLHSRAASWFIPWQNPDAEIWVQNLFNQPQTYWKMPEYFEGDLDAPEKSYELAAGEFTKLPYIPPPGQTFIHLRARNATGLRVFVRLRGLQSEIFEGFSRRQIWRDGVLGDQDTLFVTNSTPVDSRAQITTRGPSGQASTEWIDLKAFQQKKWLLPRGHLKQIEVVGTTSLLAHLEGAQKFSFFKSSPEALTALPLNPEAAYFLVSDTERSSSFVVKIDSPELIQEAREQLLNPNIRKRILIGQIQMEAGSYNQNRLSSLRNSWSWSVSKVVAFADLAPQACDGSPEMVESYLVPWVSSKTPICFWHFRLIQELPQSSKPLARESLRP